MKKALFTVSFFLFFVLFSPAFASNGESAVYKDDNITLFLISPLEFSRPNYACETKACLMLLSEIQNAKNSIDFAIYGYDDQSEILQALKAAKARGVTLRGVTDTNPAGKYSYKNTYKLVKKFDVVSDKKQYLMHNKFFIFDNEKVITGSANITKTGIGGYNSNTFVLIDNKVLAKIYNDEFNQMYGGNFQTSKQDKFFIKDIEISKNTFVSAYFSPNRDIFDKVLSPLIACSKRKIYVSAFYLTYADFADELIRAHNRGVEIKIIIDATSAQNPYSKHKILRNAGVKLKVENWGGKNHEKSMMIDDKILVLGSANFTKNGFLRNDENLLIIKNADIATFWGKNFMNLYNSIDNIYLKTAPLAESFKSVNSCYDGIDNDHDGKIDGKDEGCMR